MALWTLCWAGSIHAAEDHPFTLENGNVIEGYIADMNEETLVIRRKTGDFSERLELVYLSQDTLNWIKEQPEYASKGYDVLVDPYLELPEEEIKPPIINVKEPERPLKPVTREDASFMASLGSPIGLLLVVVLYLGNLYAAFHIALFMSRPVPLVCGSRPFFRFSDRFFLPACRLWPSHRVRKPISSLKQPQMGLQCHRLHPQPLEQPTNLPLGSV